MFDFYVILFKSSEKFLKGLKPDGSPDYTENVLEAFQFATYDAAKTFIRTQLKPIYYVEITGVTLEEKED